MGAPVVEWQLLTRDPEAASAFYRELFGWTVEDGNSLGYRRIPAGPPGIPGGIWPAPPEAGAFVQLFVEVEDVEATLARASAAGGRVVIGRQLLPDGDEMAVFLAPDGVAWGLVRHA